MGICLSTQIKAKSQCNTGSNSRNVGSDGSKVSKASVTHIPRSEGEILQSSNLKSFTFAELKAATGNFGPKSILGEGGFGSVFKGWIDEHSLTAAKPGAGIIVAIKRLFQCSMQGHNEWLAEVNYLGQFSHPHLVKLIGYCLEDERRLLVYEFMPGGSLENHLFRRGSSFQPLSWSLRLKVALGAARGLAFLHSAETQVIYGDLNTSKILLDSNYNPKLSDFRLAIDGPTGDNTHVSTRGLGTFGYDKRNVSSTSTLPTPGYAAPEHLLTGHATSMSDVYTFGVILLEMLSGRRTIDRSRPSGEQYLMEWVKPYLVKKKRFFHVLDSHLEGQYTTDEAYRTATLVCHCISHEPRSRPSMDKVVSTLEKLQVHNVSGGNKKACQ